jgi:Transposase DDE domain group 1
VGERRGQPFQFSFNGRLRVDFQGARVTSDGGLLVVRELDERLGFGELMERHLTDARGNNTQLPLADLVRQSVYSRLAGYEDVNDAERLSQDPAFRLIGSEKVLERGAALTSRLQSFETELLTQAGNLAGLAALNRELVAKGEAVDSRRRVVLDMDSTEVPVYGVASPAGRGLRQDTDSQPLRYKPHWSKIRLTWKVKTEIPDEVRKSKKETPVESDTFRRHTCACEYIDPIDH